MNSLELLRVITQFFVIVGALNWGTYGIFGIDIVKNVFGDNIYSKFFYWAIAISGILIILTKILMVA